MTGAQAIAEELKRAGITACFCYPGGTVSRLLQAIDDIGIRVIVGVNEAGAGHAAQGFFRAGGGTAVVVATSGPGVTNALTPLADSFYDHDDVLYLLGQVATNQMGRHTRQDGFQWTPTVRLTQPISIIAVEPYSHVAECVAAALEQTRGGPVVVSIPSDLLA